MRPSTSELELFLKDMRTVNTSDGSVGLRNTELVVSFEITEHASALYFAVACSVKKLLKQSLIVRLIW